MATKTIDHLDFMVDVTPYNHEGNKYDALYVGVTYSKGYGFYVSWQPVERTQWGYKTGPLPSSDKLVGGVRFLAEQAKKNSAKRIAEMHAALQLASEGIALYFDKRLFEQLNNFMRYVALYGYTPHYQQEVERLKGATEEAPVMRQYNDLKKKKPDALLLFRCGDFYEAYEQDANDVVKILGTALSKSRAAGNAYDMVGFPHYALDAYLPKLVRTGKRVAICDPINLTPNPSPKGEGNLKGEGSDNDDNSIDKSNSEDKTMKTNETIESKNVQNAQVNNAITTEADVAEVQDIMPVVTPKKSDGRGKTEEVTQPSAVSHQPSAVSHQPSAISPQTSKGMLAKVTFGTYKTKKGNDAPIITGFGGDDDPRWKKLFDAKPKWVSAGYRRDLDGNKTYHLMFGTKYMAVAKALCEAYNTIDRKAWEKAEQACAANYEGIVNGYKAEREERKAKKMAEGRGKTEEVQPSAVSHQPSAEKTYTLDEVAQKLAKLLPAGDVKLDDIKKLLKAA